MRCFAYAELDIASDMGIRLFVRGIETFEGRAVIGNRSTASFASLVLSALVQKAIRKIDRILSHRPWFMSVFERKFGSLGAENFTGF